jgi:putative component of membrane protein insertase Oxa1/YidC/SpoIIIJ protein YidD
MKNSLLNKAVIFLIVGLRPLFGTAHCKYAVSCTKFATMQLQDNSLLPAIWAIVKRVLSCNPLTQYLLLRNRL